MEFVDIMDKALEELGLDKTPITQKHQHYAISEKIKEIQQRLEDEERKSDRGADGFYLER